MVLSIDLPTRSVAYLIIQAAWGAGVCLTIESRDHHGVGVSPFGDNLSELLGLLLANGVSRDLDIYFLHQIVLIRRSWLVGVSPRR